MQRDVRSCHDVVSIWSEMSEVATVLFLDVWLWAAFWPRAALAKEHSVAIERRVLWIHVQSDLRLPAGADSQTRSL